MVGLVSIERLLELDGRDVAEVAVEALGVVPVHPSEGRELEVGDCSPRSGACRSADEFCLVVSVDRLGQSIIVTIADGPDRWCCADLGETFAVANRRELTTRVAVTPQILVMGATTPSGPSRSRREPCRCACDWRTAIPRSSG